MTGPETKIKVKIKNYLKKKGIFHVSIAAGPYSTAGISDMLVCVDGRFVAVEIKKDSKARVTELQKKFIDNVIKAGGIGFVTWSVEHLDKQLRKENLI